MKHNNIDMNISHVYDWYHSLGPSADHRLTGEPGISRFPLRGGKRTGFAGSRQATENPVNPSLCGKSRTAGIGVHLAALSQASIFFTQFFIIPCPINKKVMEQGIFAVMCELQESDLRIAITKLLCLNCNGHIPGY